MHVQEFDEPIFTEFFINNSDGIFKDCKYFK